MRDPDNKVIARIYKNVDKKAWHCLYPGCEAQFKERSHFIQRKLLTPLSKEGHFYEITDYHIENIKKKGPLSLDFRGTSKALSLPVFCNGHDRELLRSIEHNKDYSLASLSDYRIQSLFSYRACCSEIRRKEIIIEKCKRVIDAKTIRNTKMKEIFQISRDSNEQGVKYLTFFKKAFEGELFASNTSREFNFLTTQSPFLEICVSGVFSTLDYADRTTYIENKESSPNIFLNIIPKDNSLFVIAGYHSKYINKWMTSFMNSLEHLNADNYTAIITDIIAARTNSWCIPSNLYKRIPKSK